MQVYPAIANGLKANPFVESHGRIETLDMDANRQACGNPRRNHFANQCAANPLPAISREQGDVDQADLVRPAMHVESTNGSFLAKRSPGMMRRQTAPDNIGAAR